MNSNTFNNWLTEQESFSSRFERLLDDFPEVKNVKLLKQWLEASYISGYNSCRDDWGGLEYSDPFNGKIKND